MPVGNVYNNIKIEKNRLCKGHRLFALAFTYFFPERVSVLQMRRLLKAKNAAISVSFCSNVFSFKPNFLS